MINHVDLPTYLKDFVKDIDFKSLSHQGDYHGWVYYAVEDFINERGINWFESRGFDLRGELSLFRIPANFRGDIHSDLNSKVKNLRYAINIVLSGTGEMQWVSNIQGTKTIFRQEGVSYLGYKDVVDFDVIDTWRGEVGLVRIDPPHRVITWDQERYCLSLRPIYPLAFDEAKSLLSDTP